MSDVPSITLSQASVRFGEKVLFEALSLNLYPRQRTCLIGRNGCGKSTLLKATAGVLPLDEGTRFLKPGLTLTYLPQDILPRSSHQTVGDFMAEGEAHALPHFEQAAALDQARLDPSRLMTTLSGGEVRRLGLARALALKPDVLLLDEPTNHLDIAGIEELESTLLNYRGALLVISHDRYFLKRITTHMLWLDRGQLRSAQKGFSEFENWSETVWADEERQQARLNKKLHQETEWLHRGVTARRKRNQGRLSRLMQLREQKRQHLRAPGQALFLKVQNSSESRLILEVHNLSKKLSPDPKAPPLIHDFSLRVLKGERIGIMGPNGAGKTTLLKMLLGELKPDAGSVSLKSHVQIAYADQQRDRLKADRTLWQTLCEEGSDHLEVQGKPTHVASYLKSFLFDDKQFRSPVSSLSGGERNRLLLAKILLQPCDLMILDEPTNDLDVDTLDVLTDILDHFDGTLLLVSHDRDFLDRVATSIIVLEGQGVAHEYAGGYTDYLAQRAGQGLPPSRLSPKSSPGRPTAKAPPSAKMGQEDPLRAPGRLSYKLELEFKTLAASLETLSKEREMLEKKLEDPDFYQKNQDLFQKTSHELTQLSEQITQMEDRWLTLLMMKES